MYRDAFIIFQHKPQVEIRMFVWLFACLLVLLKSCWNDWFAQGFEEDHNVFLFAFAKKSIIPLSWCESCHPAIHRWMETNSPSFALHRQWQMAIHLLGCLSHGLYIGQNSWKSQFSHFSYMAAMGESRGDCAEKLMAWKGRYFKGCVAGFRWRTSPWIRRG